MGNKLLETQKEKGIFKSNRIRLSRRHFLLGTVALSTSAIIPSFISCLATPIYDIHKQLSDEDFKTLNAVQNHLFPKNQNSPGALDINASTYFTWVLTDIEKDPNDIKQMKEGIRWTNEMASKTFSRKFTHLSMDEKEITLKNLAKEGYGERWLSVVLTLIFEALLSDPIYGSNTNEVGWKWLEHTPGSPRPTAANSYNSTVI